MWFNELVQYLIFIINAFYIFIIFTQFSYVDLSILLLSNCLIFPIFKQLILFQELICDARESFVAFFDLFSGNIGDPIFEVIPFYASSLAM